MSPTPSLLLGSIAALAAFRFSEARLRRCLAAITVLALPAAAFEALGWRVGAGSGAPPPPASFHVVNTVLVLAALALALSARRLAHEDPAARAAPSPRGIALGAGAWLAAMLAPWVHLPFLLAVGLLLASTLRRPAGPAGLMAAAADGLAAICLLWGWWLIASVAPGSLMSALPDAPFSPAAEVLLGGLVGVGAIRLAAGFPLPLPGIGLIGAGLGVATLVRVVAEPMALASAHWSSGWALGLALGAVAGAITRRPARVMACLGGLGVALQGVGFVPGWVLLLAGMSWSLLAPLAPSRPARALAAAALAWAGVAALAGTMQVETVYGVVTWLAAAWAVFAPPRPVPGPAG